MQRDFKKSALIVLASIIQHSIISRPEAKNWLGLINYIRLTGSTGGQTKCIIRINMTQDTCEVQGLKTFC